MAVGFNNDIWKYVNRLPCSAQTATVRHSSERFYPNPVTSDGIITLASTCIEPPLVLDLMGRTIANLEPVSSGSNQYRMPAHVEKGIYFLRIITAHGQQDQRLVVE